MILYDLMFQGWTQLTKSEGSDIWEGEVETGDPKTVLKLNMETEDGSGQFSTLLTYQVPLYNILYTT